MSYPLWKPLAVIGGVVALGALYEYGASITPAPAPAPAAAPTPAAEATKGTPCSRALDDDAQGRRWGAALARGDLTAFVGDDGRCVLLPTAAIERQENADAGG